jgi:hypothetical protein
VIEHIERFSAELESQAFTKLKLPPHRSVDLEAPNALTKFLEALPDACRERKGRGCSGRTAIDSSPARVLRSIQVYWPTRIVIDAGVIEIAGGIIQSVTGERNWKRGTSVDPAVKTPPGRQYLENMAGSVRDVPGQPGLKIVPDIEI